MIANVIRLIAGYPKVMPTTCMALSVLASLVYFLGRDYRKALYWFSGAMLTWSITW